MLRRVRLKPFFALDGAVNFPRWNGAFFHNSVRYYRRHRAVEKVQDPVMDALNTRTEFVDAIAQQIRFRPS